MGTDTTAPRVTNLFPSTSSIAIATSFTAVITFSESVVSGNAGVILIKKLLDNTIIKAIDIATSSVVVSGTGVFFPVDSLSLNTSYYIEIPAGAFKDLSGNIFTGITGNTDWTFTTTPLLPLGIIDSTYNFNTCASSVADGFTVYNTTGAEVWACTTFGRDPVDPSGTDPFENAVQVNGFRNGTNVSNEDWLISPSFDLTNITYPLLPSGVVQHSTARLYN
jgi:hypothetical protein